MLDASRNSLPLVVLQHVEDAIVLRNARSNLLRAPDVKLHHVKRLDERLAAQLDGLAVAGNGAWHLCVSGLEMPTAATVFLPAVRALEDRNQDQLNMVLAIVETLRGTAAGVISAFGWLERASLQGTVAALLSSPQAFRRCLGIAACGVHGIDPGGVERHALRDPSTDLRVAAMSAAPKFAAVDLLPACLGLIGDEDPTCRFWASWTAVLLGDRRTAIAGLIEAATRPGPYRWRAFCLALQALNVGDAHAALQQLTTEEPDLRWRIRGSGIVGDSTYIAWLIDHMSDEKTARVAGEAFSLITGVDLPGLDLERRPPEDFESGPTDNPDDGNVDMDPDEGLPWPDVRKIEAWWVENRTLFPPATRYFLGAPVTRDHCIGAMRHGYQRQRILAAHYLCLLEPGTPLFNTSAPAWRQQRLLARM